MFLGAGTHHDSRSLKLVPHAVVLFDYLVDKMGIQVNCNTYCPDGKVPYVHVTVPRVTSSTRREGRRIL